MHIVWDNNTADATCPVCPACMDAGPKATKLRVRSAVPPNPDLPLVECGACGTHFFPTLTAPEYETAHATDDALAFYLEQGAGVDVMAEPLFAIDPARVRRYMEIGCGFGFSLDVARVVFGWTVRGVDPGFAASKGRELLGLDIDNIYLRTPADAGPDPYDLILCSEVVEHVFEPLEFLAILRGVLGDRGTLLMTTPNAGWIRPETAAGVLAPLLSPGYHATLYSRAGFEALLRRAGFASVQVVEHGPTLRAAAAAGPLDADLSRPLDRRRYRDYLARRAADVAADTPLGLGLRYRLLKELTHAGDFDAARDAARPVVEAVKRRWGFDPEDPQAIIDAAPSWPATIEGYHARAPFCLCGVLYCIGMRTLLKEEQPMLARAFFLAAGAAGEASRRALQTAGADDGETDDLAWRSRGQAAQILAWKRPDDAVAELERLATEPSPLLGESIPPAILADLQRTLFTTLVNLGHYAAADRLFTALEANLADGDDAVVASVAFALGMQALNHRKAPRMAAEWFARAYEGSLSLAGRAPGRAGDLLWQALYHQGHALTQAGRKEEAGQAFRSLLNPPKDGSVPDVPLALRTRAMVFARAHRLPV